MKIVATTPLFNKLNLGAHDEIVLFDTPDSFEAELKPLKGIKITRNPRNPKAIKFGLAFATTQMHLDHVSKGTSKRFTCDFNRDTGWSVIRDAGFDSVRQVAIDEDWSALRFRRLEYVKSSSASPGKR
jgi:hypothetical protein